MKISKALTAALMLLFAASGNAKEYDLSIEQMFKMADKNNLRLKVASANADGANAEIKAAKTAYLPSLDLRLSASYNGDGTITDRDFSDAFSAPIPHFGNNFGLEFSQPLYAGGAISGSVRMSEAKAELAQNQNDNEKQNIRFALIGDYMELCKLENQLQIFESHIKQTEKILENMRSRHKEGVALANDITRYELQLQNLNFSKIEIENAKKIISNHLASALGLEKDASFVLHTDFLENENSKTDQQWQQSAQGGSAVLKMADSVIKINESAKKLANSERLPAVFIFAADYLDGPITIDIPAQDKNFNYWTAGVMLKYSLGNLYKTDKKVKASELAVSKALAEKENIKENLRLSVQDAYIKYQESFELLKTKQKSVELARKNYNVVSYRYQNGLVLITDLLDASAQKLDAELQAVNAGINITRNYYKLKYLSGIL